MEVTNESSSLETNSGIKNKCMKNPILQVDVKIERDSDNEADSAIDLLYADHVIKEEMVIGPEVLQKPIYNSNHCKDELLCKKTKLDEKIYQEVPQKETTKETGMEEETTVSDAYIFLQKKPRLQTQEETTDRQDNTNNDTEAEITSIVDSKIEGSAYIQTQQNEKIEMVTKKTRPSNKSKIHGKIQVNYKNVNCVMSFNRGIFTCDNCGERFPRKRQLMQHIESHEIMKHKMYLKCKECMYQNLNQDSLNRHKTVHDKSRRYVCDVCGYRFKRKDILRSHLRCVHSERINKCGICDYRTNKICDLSTHLRTHTGEKPYSCSLCEFKCSHKYSLTNHMKTHTGEKPFSCTVCEYRCNTKSSLTSHMKIHTGEKPFFCTVCEYRGAHKSNLTQHMKIHTGERLFSCSMCKYKLTTKRYLTRHIKRIHNNINRK